MGIEDSVLSLANPLLRTYLVYVTLLGMKMLLMSVLTARQRMKTNSFANPEDAATTPKGKVKSDENVERVRRGHLNDLENITVFFVISLVYVLSNPSVTLATNLFRLYTAARFLHTIVYTIVVIPQPARGLAWGIGYIVTWYMAVSSLLHFLA